MSDFDKIDLYGTTYNVKDSTARNDLESAKADVPVISYDKTKTQIKVTKGI